MDGMSNYPRAVHILGSQIQLEFESKTVMLMQLNFVKVIHGAAMKL